MPKLWHKKRISIHAPTRGATALPLSYKPVMRVFQSTLPREERQSLSSFITKIFYFNPRSHERSDFSATCSHSPHRYFNPRSHERSDTKIYNECNYIDISIHAPTRGATMSVAWYQGYNLISIHAPTRGATISARV